MVATRQSSKLLPKPVPPKRRPKLAMMSCGPHRPKPKPSYWRDRKALALTEEIRDLERDVALHSTSGIPVAPSGVEDSRTQADDEQPGMQERKRGNPEPPSCAEDGQTQAHGKQPGMKKRNESRGSNLVHSRFRIRPLIPPTYSRKPGGVARTRSTGE
ncbi:hypothetical protein H4582DRAFT_2062290 [Lactarius indigo]|nr:hypothetical protein H4582DRAFT_2062290 [Lactarius indigo]